LRDLAIYCDEAKLAQAGSTAARIAEDRKLHNALAAASHNRFLEAEVLRFYDLSLRLWHLALGRVNADAISPGSHHEIVAAVRARDAERAEALMVAHILDFQQRIKAAM
jgi:DNA-binding GntR family transcriptional regulator